MAKQQRLPPPPKTCVYCGDLATSRDHVIPKSLFTPPYPQMVTVPACEACQVEKSYGDDDLAHYVSSTWAGGQNPRASEQRDRAISATKLGYSKIGRAIADPANRVRRPLTTEAGIYLFDIVEVSLPDDNRDMFRTLEYIVRGLHPTRKLQHDRRILPLPPDCPVQIRGIDRLEAESVLARFLALPHEPFVVMAEKFALWSRTIGLDDDPFSRLWFLAFNDQECFFGATGEMANLTLRLEPGVTP
jgi:hypothetical protein